MGVSGPNGMPIYQLAIWWSKVTRSSLSIQSSDQGFCLEVGIIQDLLRKSVLGFIVWRICIKVGLQNLADEANLDAPEVMTLSCAYLRTP